MAVETTLRRRPDVVLMDVRMPALDGIEATRELVAHGAPSRILILTTFDRDEYVFRALRAGASGFLLKDSPPDQLIAGIHAVARGDALLAPAITRRLVEDFASRPLAVESPALGALTARERAVLELVAAGLSNREIGARMFLAETTVKTHVGAVLGQIGARDRTQAVVFAYESGLVPAGPSPRERVVGPERPCVALGIAGRELARAVVGVLQLTGDLGAGRPRAVVQGVGVVDDHVGRAVPGVELRIAPAGAAEHHHAAPVRELGVVDDVPLAVDGLALEAEGALEEVDGGGGVLVAEGGDDHAPHGRTRAPRRLGRM
jgi:DNA-binding NarL/FixJ family response regulator